MHYVAGAGVAAAALGAITLGPMIAPALAMGALGIIVVPGITTVMGAIPMFGVIAARDYIVHDRVVARRAVLRDESGGRIHRRSVSPGSGARDPLDGAVTGCGHVGTA